MAQRSERMDAGPSSDREDADARELLARWKQEYALERQHQPQQQQLQTSSSGAAHVDPLLGAEGEHRAGSLGAVVLRCDGGLVLACKTHATAPCPASGAAMKRAGLHCMCLRR